MKISRGDFLRRPSKPIATNEAAPPSKSRVRDSGFAGSVPPCMTDKRSATTERNFARFKAEASSLAETRCSAPASLLEETVEDFAWSLALNYVRPQIGCSLANQRRMAVKVQYMNWSPFFPLPFATALRALRNSRWPQTTSSFNSPRNGSQPLK